MYAVRTTVPSAANRVTASAAPVASPATVVNAASVTSPLG
jgi:hypothetical protein